MGDVKVDETESIFLNPDNSKWFVEKDEKFWPGQLFGLKVEEVLVDEKSAFQKIFIFKNQTYGRVLVLDGVIQLTEHDEFSYQEMISMLPLCSHPCPENVLIIGGGDGGAARECAKHPQVKSVTVCEIDEKVVELSKKFLPKLACGFDSPKVHLTIDDGLKFVSNPTNHNKYDVIITDSSDPIGPATQLFEQPYYELLKKCLNGPDGIICSQGESIWLDLPLITKVTKFCQKLFGTVGYATLSCPTYTCGQIGLMLCSPKTGLNFSRPTFPITVELAKSLGLRYYNHRVHEAALALPQFVTEALN